MQLRQSTCRRVDLQFKLLPIRKGELLTEKEELLAKKLETWVRLDRRALFALEISVQVGRYLHQERSLAADLRVQRRGPVPLCL